MYVVFYSGKHACAASASLCEPLCVCEADQRGGSELERLGFSTILQGQRKRFGVWERDTSALGIVAAPPAQSGGSELRPVETDELKCCSKASAEDRVAVSTTLRAEGSVLIASDEGGGAESVAAATAAPAGAPVPAPVPAPVVAGGVVAGGAVAGGVVESFKRRREEC
eukprot:6178743-Pleurochrysis_carterae.AAC.1